MWDAKWTDINMEEYVKYSKDWDTIMKAGGANYDQLTVLERDADNTPTLCYSKLKFGMLMTDRDALTKINSVFNKDDIDMEFTNGEHPDYPIAEDCIRALFNGVAISHRDGNGLKTREVNHGQVGGYIPSSLLNMSLAAQTKDRIIGFYEGLKLAMAKG